MLRAWKREDILEIAQIEQRCFPKSAWTKEQIDQAFLHEGFYSVLYQEEQIKGYLGAVLNEWEAEIAFIAVDIPYRRQSIAEKMIDYLIEFARKTGRDKIFLEVRRSNIPAQNLYAKKGFKTYSIRKNYYEGTEDAICMVFEVNG